MGGANDRIYTEAQVSSAIKAINVHNDKIVIIFYMYDIDVGANENYFGLCDANGNTKSKALLKCN